MQRLTLLLAAFALAASFAASPIGAADRPVGPETGQARVSEDDAGSFDPDDADGRPWWTSPGIAPLSENDQRELARGCPAGARGRICRWMQNWERNNGPIGF